MKYVLIFLSMLFILYYKIDCNNEEISHDLPEDVIRIEIDQKTSSPEHEIYIEKNQEDFTRINLTRRGDSSNNYGKKYIKGYIHNTNLENEIPPVIVYNSNREYREPPNSEVISLLKRNYTYKDTWLLNGDNWCLYILSADTLFNEFTGVKAGGVTFLVTPFNGDFYAPLSVIASAYIEKKYTRNYLAREVAVAHEIGHIFQSVQYECWDCCCIMYRNLEDPPRDRFCIRFEEMFCNYYLPKRYGRFGLGYKRR
ncbi:MAG: hypothetical protein ABIK76_05040 [candidate division WOR-3 bacterium]